MFVNLFRLFVLYDEANTTHEKTECENERDRFFFLLSSLSLTLSLFSFSSSFFASFFLLLFLYSLSTLQEALQKVYQNAKKRQFFLPLIFI